ncbi:EFR1 family ferrodoxin [Clostridium sp.]|uniref:EFR1 family ferrodoxin n=1 Tax=Clostridium sp. TaxID=1506 RepID=UPI00359FC7AD
MKKLGVFYFSGTGNTEIAAKHVAQAFIQLGWSVELIRIEDVNKKKIQLDINQYDLIGLGSQVIGYGIPRVVRNFARAFPAASDNKKVFVFRTAGGVVPSNYNASKGLIRILKHKHYDVCYEELFSIGSNWIVKYDDVIMKQLYIATIRKITRMCKAIEQGERHFYKTGIALRIKMGVIATFSSGILSLLGKDAVIDKSCTECGLCVKRCPAENISIEKGKVKFHASCSACLRCVYSCPNYAINFRLLHFVIIPGGYNVKISLSADGNPDEKPNGKIPPFFQEYVED